MKKQFALMTMGLASLGAVSSLALAQNNKVGLVQSQYELIKSCKKGFVKTKKGKCIKLVCKKSHYLNKAKTKCLPKRTMQGGSPKSFYKSEY